MVARESIVPMIVTATPARKLCVGKPFENERSNKNIMPSFSIYCMRSHAQNDEIRSCIR